MASKVLSNVCKNAPDGETHLGCRRKDCEDFCHFANSTRGPYRSKAGTLIPLNPKDPNHPNNFTPALREKMTESTAVVFKRNFKVPTWRTIYCDVTSLTARATREEHRAFIIKTLKSEGVAIDRIIPLFSGGLTAKEISSR